MRNLVKYPVTKEEIVEYCRKLQEEIMATDVVGDIRPVILETLIVLVNDFVPEQHVLYAQGLR